MRGVELDADDYLILNTLFDLGQVTNKKFIERKNHKFLMPAFFFELYLTYLGSREILNEQNAQMVSEVFEKFRLMCAKRASENNTENELIESLI